MPNITLPDGSQKQFDGSVTGFELAESIGAGLAKAALALEVNGEQQDLSTPITADAHVKILTAKDEGGLDVMRHTLAAQVLAKAIKELYPSAKLAIGPTIEKGFYYDVDFEESISSDELEVIEAKMREIIARDEKIQREDWPVEKAKALFAERGESYKVDIIENSGNTDTISLYRHGESSDAFMDLCRGPHTPNLGKIAPHFKLMSLAGAYWRGDSDNKMLTRIYAAAFNDKKELADYLIMLEEAAKRDHRKLGKQLKFFTFAPEEIGPGLPIWLPNGTIVRDELEAWARSEEKKAGYLRVVTPILTKESLYYKSGHLPYYKDDLYAPMDIDGENYYLRPMNCPHHHHVFLSEKRSYRDMPLRIAEYGNVFRYEAHGGLSGLLRTRGFCQNDAHIYCREDQAEEEFLKVMDLHARFYNALGIKDYHMRLSLPDLNKLDKYVDEPEEWLKALGIIRGAMKKSGLDYVEVEGEAAFYGPKVDFQIKSVIGVEYTISTNQLDFLATKRFDLTYTGDDGQQHPVYVIHRAPLGSHERFVAFLLEHFCGHFPLWLSPTQVVVTPITDSQSDYAVKLVERLREAGLRAEVDIRNEKVNYKIREHSLQKVPVIAVIGDREIENDSVTVRRLGSTDQTAMTIDNFITSLQEEINTKALPSTAVDSGNKQ